MSVDTASLHKAKRNGWGAGMAFQSIQAASFTISVVGAQQRAASFTSYDENVLWFGNAGDLTGDGHAEVVLSGWTVKPGQENLPANATAPVYVLTPDSSGRLSLAPASSFPALQIPGTGDVLIADFNGDGLQDAFLAGYTDYPVRAAPYSTLILGSRTGNFEVRQIPIALSAHSTAAGDVDGNGTIDVIVSSYIGDSNGADPLVLLNDGAANFSLRSFKDGQFAGSSTVSLADFNNDGRQDIFIGDTAVASTNYKSAASIIIEPGTATGSVFQNATTHVLPTPYFDASSAYANVPSNFDPRKNHEIESIAADLNNDGLTDLISFNLLWSPELDYGSPQILINKGNFVFADETSSRLLNYQERREGAHDAWLMDVNGDGFKDLILGDLPDFDTDSSGATRAIPNSHGNEVLFNDGTGRFLSVMRNAFEDFATAASTSNTGYFLPNIASKWVPVLGADGVLSFVTVTRGFLSGSVQDVILQARANDVLSTGPGGIDPATRGAPGYSEAYYLFTNPDVAAAVKAGTLASGLDHYLSIGRAEGRPSAAPNSRSGDDVINGGATNDQLDGGSGSDHLNGGGGNDQLQGGLGDDVLIGGAGADKIDGGAGYDVASWFGEGPGLVLNLANQALNAGAASGDVVANVEQFELTAGADQFTGAGATVYALGFGGDDQLTGSSAADALDGGEGNDQLNGGAGADILAGQAGNDVLLGGAGNDFLDAGAGDDLASGEDGDDYVLGREGSDTLDGGAGADQVDGGEGNDTIGGGTGDDIIGGADGNDYVFGAEGNDYVAGGAGTDLLFGAQGNDVLFGGADSDVFYYRGGDGSDTILDFVAGSTADVIDLIGTEYGSFAQVQANLTYFAAGNATVLSFSGGAQLLIQGVTPGQLDASDFWFNVI